MNRVPAILAAALLIAGGAVQLYALTIDYVALRAYAAVFVLAGLGFVLVLAGSAITVFVFTPTWAWSTFAFGSFSWFLSWSCPLLLYYFLPVPPFAWAVLATAAYLASVVISLIHRKLMSGVSVGIVALGSIGSVYLMQIPADTLSPDYIYAPLATAALITGVIWGAAVWRDTALVRGAV